MSTTRRPLAEVLASLPIEWADNPQPALAAALQARQEKVVVLDDDPTGNQTVHDVPVLTEWSVPTLTTELANDLPVFFLLTNSRSLPLPKAQELNAEIGRNLRKAAQRIGKRFVVASRLRRRGVSSAETPAFLIPHHRFSLSAHTRKRVDHSTLLPGEGQWKSHGTGRRVHDKSKSVSRTGMISAYWCCAQCMPCQRTLP